ncbi:hypothetical protein [Sharpea azabuensis]|uniref:hypothetical protein n=1 Tax=Sharpea azabuensis TaxID=322505 RepID=UPI0013DA8C74|nr:hypothetical protein [Sharpea azabuensis]
MIEELMSEGQFSAALEKLNDLNDEKTRYLRLVCLNAMGEYRQSMMEGANAKAMAKETYYDVLVAYLEALKECEEYEKAIDILVEELGMPYIPYEYESLFNEVYDQILLEKQEMNAQLDRSQIFSIEEIEKLLDRKNVNDDLLYMALDQMTQLNIRMLLPALHRYLEDDLKPAFAKTLIMETLIQQQIDDEFEVHKNGHIYDFNPAISALVLERECYQGIGKQLVRVLEDDNPALMNQCIDYLEYFLYASYPQEIYEDEYALYAAGIHYYVASMQNIDVSEVDLEVDYNVNLEMLEEVLLALKSIE